MEKFMVQGNCRFVNSQRTGALAVPVTASTFKKCL